MRKENWRNAFVTLLVGGALALGAFGLSRASDSYLTDFETQYPAAVGTKIDSCLLCHINANPGPTARNAYGTAWRNANYSFTAIEGLDSDGDGFTNKQEITALTFPGNAADFPAADTTLPTVTGFTIPATATSLTVTITTFTATDNVLVTGYLLSETSSKPAAGAAGWTATAPTTYIFSTAGAKILYAWAKDAAGNVSNSISAAVTITLPDATLPVVTSFIVPPTATSLTTTVTVFTATDNVLVTGYLITETPAKPAPNATGWSATAPTSYTFSLPGAVTLYAWAKDAAGNVSNSMNQAVTVTATTNLFAGFTAGSPGLKKWDGTAWTQIGTSQPTNMAAAGSKLYATFSGVNGTFKWDGATWTQVGNTSPASITASGSSLYAYFTGYGLYTYNGTAWTRIGTSQPTNMAAAGSKLYATFSGVNGTFKWDGATWTQVGNTSPASITASGSSLYAYFTGYGLYTYNGTAWTRIGTSQPTNMAALGSTLYATFSGVNGTFKWDGATWTKIGEATAASITASGAKLYANFTGFGVYEWAGSGWNAIATVDPLSMVAGSF